MEEILGTTLRKGKDSVTLEQVLTDTSDFIAIYFGAHWASPCRLFTPSLTEFYSKINGSSKKLEVVFCSIDGNEAAFERNYEEMPFCAIPYTDEQRIQNLKQRFGINGIPTLVVLDKKGEMVSFEGRIDIQNH